MRKISYILALLLLHTAALSGQVREEDIVYGAVEELVTDRFIRYCHTVRTLPDFCKNKADISESSASYCEELRQRYITDTSEYGQLPKFLLLHDTLITLDVRSTIPYLLKISINRTADSLFLINVPVLPPVRMEAIRYTCTEKVLLASFQTFRDKNPDLRFGKNKHVLNLGFLVFSRPYLDPERSRGIMEYNYLGDSQCGYNGYVFLKNSNGIWNVEKWVETGVY